MSYSSSLSYVGGTRDEASYVYYNADIINTRTSDLTNGVVVPDPPIRFNETRASPIIADASKYHFSIVRFYMDGPNRNLPLFIPEIIEGQPNINLTAYSVAIPYKQTWNTSLGAIAFNVKPTPTNLLYSPENQNPVVAPLPRAPIPNQDISTQYYWVSTYEHFLKILNQAMSDAYLQTYLQFQNEWLAAGLTAPNDTFPYPTFESFVGAHPPPRMVYSPSTKRFTLYMDSDAYGNRINPFTPIAYTPAVAWNIATVYAAGDKVTFGGAAYQSLSAGNVGNQPNISPAAWALTTLVGPASPPQCALYMNTNLYNLFAGFQSIYYNVLNNPTWGTVPSGYSYEIQVPDKFYQNLIDYSDPPFGNSATVPPVPGYVPVIYQKLYWINEQDYQSTDTLWSPISSIVFTSTLMPVRAEATGSPVILGESNLGSSTPTTNSAFEPIVTDISLSLAEVGAEAYKSMIYYAPTAEYRMSDFGPSRQEVRNIDIQVFWRCRLNNVLYPITIPNGGNVNFKMMFRHRDLSA